MSASSASSRSGSAGSEHPEMDENSASRLFDIYKPAFRRHYEVKSTDDQCLYYGDISSFTRNKPDLTLHAGTGDQAPVVAAAKFIKLSGQYKLCLGDPNDMNNAQWEDMTKDRSLHPRHRFEMTIPSYIVPDQSERRAFLWKRTRSVIADGAKPLRLNMRNFKLIDARTEKVVAVFTRERSFSKCGRLQIQENYGENFETMVLISCISLYERLRRRNNSAAASGGGAGGA
ncbi:hypothetical protein N7462_006844 [Penicillium macrosclerotiorum]|uniref:uncharacterized protein n=1 Tax=Penicillium macrosclerotiorum TaxID=303699 RepID=UPI0025494181|nr:uncharacterized protein N7462_006844 [Penicillium macrosclerotiorum]KAJ5678600.1 hypothetical protein N7462_006844 [Penicillium macrosclerotiorum]